MIVKSRGKTVEEAVMVPTAMVSVTWETPQKSRARGQDLEPKNRWLAD
jgi:hypothetical protein